MRADSAWPLQTPNLSTGRQPAGQVEADAAREADQRRAALRAVAGSASGLEDFHELCQILGLDPVFELRGSPPHNTG